MTVSTFVFLAIRSLHVLLAAAWVGTIAFVTLFLLPALEQAGPAEPPLMSALGRRGIHAFIASMGGITVLTGMWLYWRFTGGFQPALSATMGARVFGAGGVAGIFALIFWGSIVGRAAKKLTTLGAQVAGLPDSQRGGVMAEIVATRRRLNVWGKIVLALQVIALVCMAIGHYV